MNTNKKAFTLVELIVVITILAILWTIAFISMQWYSVKSRDSVRVSDMKTIGIWLELYHLQVWKYPDPSNWTDITYSWWVVWTQWTFWDNVVVNISKINEKPTDPLTGVEYTYSVLNNKQEYQLWWSMEWDLVTFDNSLVKVNAEGEKIWTAYVTWNYNAQIARVSTWWLVYVLAIPSIIGSDISTPTVDDLVSNKKLVYEWFSKLPSSYTWTSFKLDWEPVLNLTNTLVVYTWLTAPSTSWELLTLMTNLKQAYTWTDLITNSNYQEIINLDVYDSEKVSELWANIVNSNWGSVIVKPLITQSICKTSWWIWVDSEDDVYIWSKKWNWFCISPRYWDWNSDSELWDWWVSWNWWWHNSDDMYKWWDSYNTSDWWDNDYAKWQTRTLNVADWSNNEVDYTCKALWTATSDYINTDTLEWRMKWLATIWNDYTEAQNIDWINAWTLLNWHTVPVLFLADCIDWIRDLWGDMLYKHQPDENLNETITYLQYNEDVQVDTQDVDTYYQYLWNGTSAGIVYQNRQKYLTAWTQKSWSHLPSAFSYIKDDTAWWEKPSWGWFYWDSFSHKTANWASAKWEYQIACDIWKFWAVTWDDYNEQYVWSSDNIDGERMLLAAIGDSDSYEWWSTARVLGHNGCGMFLAEPTGHRSASNSTRFVVRP